MEPWWFLEPLLYTGFVVSAIGVVIGYIIYKLTDGISDAPSVIVLVAAISMIIAILLWVKGDLNMGTYDSTINWVQIRAIIDDVIKKHDRSVSIYIHPENGMSVNVYPWPDYEDLYEMYKDGKITFNDFRAKAGLPMMKEEDFIRSSYRFDVQEIKE